MRQGTCLQTILNNRCMLQLDNEILKLDKIRSNQDDNVFINENLLSDLFDTSEESKDTQENILDELDALGEMIASIPDTNLDKKLKDDSEDPVVIINIRYLKYFYFNEIIAIILFSEEMKMIWKRESDLLELESMMKKMIC